MTPEDRIEMPESPPPPALNKDSRRRLLRGGLAAAPALLTLVNRPVMAAPCFAGSVSLSANLSRGNKPIQCLGFEPQTWVASLELWPAPMAVPGESTNLGSQTTAEADASTADKKGKGESPSTLSDSEATAEQTRRPKQAGTTFNSVFGKQGGYGNSTLLEVLKLNSNSGRDGLARHLVAAYLNALKGYTPAVILDVVTTKSIWTSFVARGYYEPTAGIRWFPDYAEPANPRGGVIAWIKTTMPN